MSAFALWWHAIRPRTLPLSASPVILGSLLAWAQNGHLWFLPALVALFCSICIQIGTNLFNDVADFENGVDSASRLGPPRVVAQGWLPAEQVKKMAFFFFFLAFLGGIYLVYHAGWVIFWIGIFSLLSGWAYTCGPYPIAYRPLGELFVWIFFGIFAVCGSFYLQTQKGSWIVFWVASSVGMLSAAVMTINNYRDWHEDQRHHKNTLAVFLGPRNIKIFFVFEMLIPFLIVLFLLPILKPYGWLPFLCLPVALNLMLRFCTQTGRALNVLLATCAQMQFVFSLLLGAAFCLG